MTRVLVVVALVACTPQLRPHPPARCPNPYDSDGWVPKEEVSEGEARAMNEKLGLICSKRGELAGCTDERGRIVIPFTYVELSPFSESGITLALHPKDGWVYIDSRHRRIGKALTLDNTPDEVFGGYARFQAKNGEIGFLDRERRIVIPARYDAAYPFNGCRALVCVGCHPSRWSKGAPVDAACTGDAFMIDESGKRLEPLAAPDGEHCGGRRKSP